MYTQYADHILEIVKAAGKIIMEHYDENLEIEIKDDNSPVTIADKEANDYIVARLAELAPEITIIAEENAKEDNILQQGDRYFWLVDPLDGTKSFIKHTGEFTVNIGLIDGDTPIGGAIYVPAQGVSYFVGSDGKAYKQEQAKPPQEISVREIPTEGAIVVASKSHSNEETENFIDQIPQVADRKSAASSLKFCVVAAGQADIYPRFGRTMEWDTAAGHAIILAAGGVVKTPEGNNFTYRKQDFANGFFIASAS